MKEPNFPVSDEVLAIRILNKLDENKISVKNIFTQGEINLLYKLCRAL